MDEQGGVLAWRRAVGQGAGGALEGSRQEGGCTRKVWAEGKRPCHALGCELHPRVPDSNQDPAQHCV